MTVASVDLFAEIAGKYDLIIIPRATGWGENKEQFTYALAAPLQNNNYTNCDIALGSQAG